MKSYYKKPLSWSQLSSFEYAPQEWYSRYVLGKKQQANQAMVFGSYVGEKIAKDKKFIPKLPRLPIFEYKLSASFDGIPLIGYIDSYKPHTRLYEYKTGKPAWTQKRADTHGQIDMYLLIIYLAYKVRPEDIECKLMWLPTQENGDFSVSLINPVNIHIFDTRRTMVDILRFGDRIKNTIVEMNNYAEMRESA